MYAIVFRTENNIFLNLRIMYSVFKIFFYQSSIGRAGTQGMRNFCKDISMTRYCKFLDMVLSPKKYSFIHVFSEMVSLTHFPKMHRFRLICKNKVFFNVHFLTTPNLARLCCQKRSSSLSVFAKVSQANGKTRS
jgi:hypothetical protein